MIILYTDMFPISTMENVNDKSNLHGHNHADDQEFWRSRQYITGIVDTMCQSRNVMPYD